MVFMLMAFETRSFAIDLNLTNPAIYDPAGGSLNRYRNEPVVVKGSQIYDFGVIFKIPCSSIVVTDSSDNPVPYQVDDYGADGLLDETDEIVFLAKFNDGQTSSTYKLYFDSKEFSDVVSRQSGSAASYYLPEFWTDSSLQGLDLNDNKVITSESRVLFYLNTANLFDVHYNEPRLVDGTPMYDANNTGKYFWVTFRAYWNDGTDWQAHKPSSMRRIVEGPLRVVFEVTTQAENSGVYKSVFSRTKVAVYTPGPGTWRNFGTFEDVTTKVYFETETWFEESVSVSSGQNWDGKRGTWLQLNISGAWADSKYFRGVELASTNGQDNTKPTGYSESSLWDISGGSGDWGDVNDSDSYWGYPFVAAADSTGSWNGNPVGVAFIFSSFESGGFTNTNPDEEKLYFDSWGADPKFFVGRHPSYSDTTLEAGSYYKTKGLFIMYKHDGSDPLRIPYDLSQELKNPVQVSLSMGAGTGGIALSVQKKTRSVDGLPVYLIKGYIVDQAGRLNPVDAEISLSASDPYASYPAVVYATAGEFEFEISPVSFGRVEITATCPALGLSSTYTVISESYLNLDHLNYLTEVRYLQGRWMGFTWLYSCYPRYERVRDPGEGAACVDDTARAALVYLEYYKIFQDSASLSKLRNIISFLDYMDSEAAPEGYSSTADDAQWWNFINEDGTIHAPTHSNSETFGSAWTARAIGAMGRAYKLFKEIGLDDLAADYIKPHIDSAISIIKSHYENYGYDRIYHGFVLPFIIWDNAKTASWALPGLVDYYLAKKVLEGATDTDLEYDIEKTTSAMVRFLKGDYGTYPFYAILSADDNPFKWQAYGSYQVYALAYAALQLKDDAYFGSKVSSWIDAACKCADSFYAKLLTWHFPGSEGFNPTPRIWPKIAYAVSPMVCGLAALRDYFKAVGDTEKYEKYAKMCGIAASFWFGNNPMGVPAYDPFTGISFDGLDSDGTVNRDSGGESTVETLFALLYALKDPLSASMVKYSLTKKRSPLVFEVDECDFTLGEIHNQEGLGDWKTSGEWFSNYTYIDLYAGGKLERKFLIENPFPNSPCPYFVYLSYIRKDFENVGVNIYIDGEKISYFSFGGAPSGDYYIWIARAAGPVWLSEGEHTLTIEAVGGKVQIDQIWIVPSVCKACFSGEGGDYTIEAYWDDPSTKVVLTLSDADYQITPAGVLLSWKEVSGARGYLIYRGSVLITPEPVSQSEFLDPFIPSENTVYTIYPVADDSFGTLGNPAVLEVSLPSNFTSEKVDLTEYPENWYVFNKGFLLDFDQPTEAVTKSLVLPDGEGVCNLIVSNPEGTLWSLSVEFWDESTYDWISMGLISGSRGEGEYKLKVEGERIRFKFSLPEGGCLKILGMWIDGKKGPVWILNEWWPSEKPVVSFTPSTKVSFSNGLTIEGEDPVFLRIPVAGNLWNSVEVLPKTVSHCRWALYLETEQGKEYLIWPTSSSETQRVNLESLSGYLVLMFLPGSTGSLEFSSITLFGPIARDLCPSFKGPKAYPDPFTPSGSDPAFKRAFIKFEGHAKVEIYSMDGVLVRKLEGTDGVFWDGRDEKGNLCPTGLYLIKIESDRTNWASVTLVR